MLRFDKYRKRDILEEPKFSFPEDRKQVEFNDDMVNYVHLKFAGNSKKAIVFTLVALSAMLIAVKLTLDNQGNPELNVSAYAFTSILFSILGITYAINSMYEKNVKHLLSYVALIGSGVQFLIWFMLIYLGQRG